MSAPNPETRRTRAALHPSTHRPVWGPWKYKPGSTVIIEGFCEVCKYRRTKTSSTDPAYDSAPRVVNRADG